MHEKAQAYKASWCERGLSKSGMSHEQEEQQSSDREEGEKRSHLIFFNAVCSKTRTRNQENCISVCVKEKRLKTDHGP